MNVSQLNSSMMKIRTSKRCIRTMRVSWLLNGSVNLNGHCLRCWSWAGTSWSGSDQTAMHCDTVSFIVLDPTLALWIFLVLLLDYDESARSVPWLSQDFGTCLPASPLITQQRTSWSNDSFNPKWSIHLFIVRFTAFFGCFVATLSPWLRMMCP